jgi:DNA modification methylase
LTIIPQVELIPISDLKVDGENPNRMTERQREALSTSMDRYGFIIPIITNKDLLIADGEQRWEVAKERGMAEVPVVKLDVEDVDRRLLRQVLNKLKGQHREELDAQEFLRIVEAGEQDTLQALISLSERDVQRYLDLVKDPKEEEYDAPDIDIIQTDIQRGEIHQLGNHRLMCGDATLEDDAKQLMGEAQADMVFTDPPYTAFGSSDALAKDIVDDKMIRPFLRGFMGNIRLHTKLGGHIYIFTDCKTYPAFHEENKVIGLSPKNLIVWYKRNARLGSMYSNSHELIWFLSNRNTKKRLTQQLIHEKTVYGETNVWDIPINTTKERLIFSQKPIEVCERAIHNSSENPDIVLDLFGGSGSTLIACEQTGRTCYMMEIDPRYCQIIIDRWEAYTGQTAVKVKE